MMYETRQVPAEPDAMAPDGFEVRILAGFERGGMAHFQLASGRTSRAVTHRTVEEIWYFISGRGQIWRQQDGRASIVDVSPGVSLTIPLGTHFQFRALGADPLTAVGVTIPPWPGEDEAVPVIGEWEPTL